MGNLGDFRPQNRPAWLERQQLYHGVSRVYPDPQDDDDMPPSMRRALDGIPGVDAPPPAPGGSVERPHRKDT